MSGMKVLLPWLACTAIIVAPSVADAQNVDARAAVAVNYSTLKAMKIPVVPGDVVDRPYKVIATIDADLTSHTIFSKPVSDEKAFYELWERGKKKGADAVVNATLSKGSFGSRNARGDAIKFLTDAEIMDLERK